MIPYGIAPYCKCELLKQINLSLYFSLSFDDSLNSMSTYDFGTMKAASWRLDTFILSFWRDPTLIISFKVYMKDSTSGLNEANIFQLAMDGPNVN